MKYRISVVSHIGYVRTVNQDNFFCGGRYRALEESIVEFNTNNIGEEPWMTAIFDGMGGEKDGEIASLIAGKMAADRARSAFDIDLNDLIMSTNTQICHEMASRKCHMGSTCVFLEFDNEKCRSWNIGDSRAYRYHNGILSQMSEDHTEAASFSEIFKGESVAKTGSENKLTQHLGIPEDDFIIEPYISSWVEVSSGDILLLCSDGLTHMTEDKAIGDILSQDLGLEEKRSHLLDRALESGGMDNVTIIVVEAY